MQEVPEYIVDELRQSVRAPFVSVRMQPVDPLRGLTEASIRLRSRPFIEPKKSLPDWHGIIGLIPWIAGASIVIAGLLLVSQYGNSVKSRVVQDGNAAIGHLVEAKDNLERLDIGAAKNDLASAKAEFDSASSELDILGPTLVGLLSHIPGLTSLKTGHALLSAGTLLSDAGTSLSNALDALGGSGMSVGSMLAPFKDALTKAQSNVSKASILISDVDADKVPEQYRKQFTDLRERLPAIRNVIDRGVAAAAFLSSFTGTDRPHQYLVLFANSSELRPTGGFPGSYGLLTFENGAIKSFSADDVYNPDGQIHELIVPPKQLQHITPGWGMRDAAWWIDGPTSAKKVMEYWQKGGGTPVDGVLSIRPDVLAGILKITGQVSLPDYDLVLTSENVLTTLQQEVESKKTSQPKQVIVDLAPIILRRLSSASSAQWAQLLVLFKEALDTRDITMYANDASLEKFIASEKWDGAVQQTSGDYLMADISNIKGAKTDAVTDTNIKLESWLENGTMVHRLTLTRQHNGNSSSYGFYNKPNYSWVRVLVPKGSVLRGISGNSKPSYKSLMTYTANNSIRDPDLQALEATYHDSVNGSITYTESEKTGFGFWMAIQPGETESVQLEYEVPARYISGDYHLFVQRQPGLDLSNFEFTIQKNGISALANAMPALVSWPDSWRYHGTLERDLDLSVQLK